MHLSNDPKRQLWERRFRQFENSPLSVSDFCDSVGCSTASFYQWKRKLEANDHTAEPARSPQAAFLQVQSQPDSAIEIKLHSGIVISIPVEAISALPQILEAIS
jgi:transposase-like protein